MAAPHRSVADRLAADAKQAATHAQEIKKGGGAVDEVWIVTNYEHAAIESELQRTKTRNRSKMDDHEIQFVEAADLPKRLTSSKSDKKST